MQTDVNAAGSDRSWMSVSMNDLDGFGDQKFPGPCDDVLLNAKAGVHRRVWLSTCSSSYKLRFAIEDFKRPIKLISLIYNASLVR